jgi:hypothetical protein
VIVLEQLRRQSHRLAGRQSSMGRFRSAAVSRAVLKLFRRHEALRRRGREGEGGGLSYRSSFWKRSLRSVSVASLSGLGSFRLERPASQSSLVPWQSDQGFSTTYIQQVHSGQQLHGLKVSCLLRLEHSSRVFKPWKGKVSMIFSFTRI